jgi:hypothetical protein
MENRMVKQVPSCGVGSSEAAGEDVGRVWEVNVVEILGTHD